MKTLVIHPRDITTKFLEGVYAGKNWTIITDASTSKEILQTEIKLHDRIVMLGHGSPIGLFSYGDVFIDSSYVPYLKEKEIVAIWCNAAQFVEKYDLQGFYTGMIISEMKEALFCDVSAISTDIDESNILFTKAIFKSIDCDDMLQSMRNEYNYTCNDVIYYNKQNLFQRKIKLSIN